MSRKVKLTSSGYRDWWATYEEGGIRTDQTPPDSLRALAARAVAVFSSTRRRAIETARAVAGDRPFTSDILFIEAPLPPPPLPDAFKVSPRSWGVIARAAWWLGYGEGGETRAEAEDAVRRLPRDLARFARLAAEHDGAVHGGTVGSDCRRRRALGR